MAKKTFNLSFQKAEIFFDNEDIVIVEKLKEEKSYSLTEMLRSLEGIKELSIKISYDNEIPSE